MTMSDIKDLKVNLDKIVDETFYLCSIPNMKESILQASREDIKDCSNSLDW